MDCRIYFLEVRSFDPLLLWIGEKNNDKQNESIESIIIMFHCLLTATQSNEIIDEYSAATIFYLSSKFSLCK